MKKASFGFISVCKHQNETVEYLEFYKEGRLHQHSQKEQFTVLQGKGFLITDKMISPILEGETYVVPAQTVHKMKPQSSVLKILVTYSAG